MQAEPALKAAADRRAGNRSNVMLGATLVVGAAHADVRIRNLSPTGALLELPLPPASGTRLRLRRFAHEASGRVIWSAQHRCGVAFDQQVSVADWIAAARAGAFGSVGQRRVDAIQQAVRSGAGPVAPASVASIVPVDLQPRVAAELTELKRIVEALGDELIADPVVVMNHSGALQSLDLISQSLAALASVITADDLPRALAAIGVSELRDRLSGV